MNGQQALFVAVAGLVGGLVNAVISGPLERPRRVRLDKTHFGYNLGLLGNVFVGGVASFTVWALGITSSTEPQVYGIAILSGLGGARILSSLLEGQIARFEREKLANALAEDTEEKLEELQKSES